MGDRRPPAASSEAITSGVKATGSRFDACAATGCGHTARVSRRKTGERGPGIAPLERLWDLPRLEAARRAVAGLGELVCLHRGGGASPPGLRTRGLLTCTREGNWRGLVTLSRELCSVDVAPKGDGRSRVAAEEEGPSAEGPDEGAWSGGAAHAPLS